MTYEVGQLCRVKGTGYPELDGAVCTIAGTPGRATNVLGITVDRVYPVDIELATDDPPGCFAGFPEENLVPIDDDDYDGTEEGSWDECPWQPKELVCVES